jgi:hypothetical protein
MISVWKFVGSADDAHDVLFTHHDQILAAHFDFGPAVFTEENFVADLQIERADLAAVEKFAFADCDHFAEDRLLGRGIGNDNAAGGFALLGFALDDQAVVQGTNVM